MALIDEINALGDAYDAAIAAKDADVTTAKDAQAAAEAALAPLQDELSQASAAIAALQARIAPTG